MEITVRRDPDRLYDLLPALYREADAEQGFPLRALLRLIGVQADLLHADIQQLWDDLFIETCRRWAIPYIGELVGNNLLHDVEVAAAARTAEELFPDLAGPDLRPGAAIRLRADVARTIYYRRRKGTLPMLEELARDVTGWPAHAVEFFERLSWTQNVNHLRPFCTGAPDLRRVDVGDRVQRPFDATSHMVDVRRIGQAEGWHGVCNVGFFLWRLRSYPVRVAPRAIDGTTWRYTFSPLGNAAPLFSPARREAEETALATERHVPAPIRPAGFHEDLKRFALTTPAPGHTDYYGDPASYPDASIALFEGTVPVPAEKIACVNLEGWSAFAQPTDDKIGLDVRRGRYVVGSGRAARPTTVYYSYGFSADLGGGPYDRAKWLVREEPGQRRFSVGPGGTHATLDDALAAWATAPPRPDTIITILDNGTYALSAPVSLDPAGWLAIEAATHVRPHIAPAGGVIQIGPPEAGPGSELTLSGLLVEGGVAVTQDIRRLRLLHTTLVPGRTIAEDAPATSGGTSLDINEGTAGSPVNVGVRVEIAFSITGPLRIPAHAAGLWLLDSIVDGTARLGSPRVAAIADAAGADGPSAVIERSTIFGTAFFRQLLLASETVFTDPVTVARQQDGCVRFSYVPRGSVTPRQYRCQPALEIAAETDRRRAAATGTSLPPDWEETLAREIAAWLAPTWAAAQYGRPEYAQLHLSTPHQIRAGAEDGSEMGAFNHLKQPQREANLRVRLDEYLPVGLEAGLIYVT